MGFLLQARPITTTWGIAEIAVAVIVIAAISGIVAIACQQFGVAIPQCLAGLRHRRRGVRVHFGRAFPLDDVMLVRPFPE